MLSNRFYKLCLLVSLLIVAVDARRRQNRTSTSLTEEEDEVPRVHYLVEMIGKELYAAVSKPKYKFYIYMTVGSLPNEQNTILLISTICNVLYGSAMLAGFLLFQRGPMLLFTLATLWIGPALVLILLGLVAGVLAAFAFYPLASVAAMATWFFMTSQLAQQLGKQLGLDSDGDGDVDWLDLLHALSKTSLGETLRLGQVHEFFNQIQMDPFQELHRRLDRMEGLGKKSNGSTNRKGDAVRRSSKPGLDKSASKRGMDASSGSRGRTQGSSSAPSSRRGSGTSKGSGGGPKERRISNKGGEVKRKTEEKPGAKKTATGTNDAAKQEKRPSMDPRNNSFSQLIEYAEEIEKREESERQETDEQIEMIAAEAVEGGDLLGTKVVEALTAAS